MRVYSIEHRTESKLSRHLPNCAMSTLFQDFSLAVFRYLKVKFRNKRADKQQQKNRTKVCKHTRRRNLRYYNVSRESPQGVNEMDSPSFERFHAQLDCKLTYGNKNQTQLTHV